MRVVLYVWLVCLLVGCTAEEEGYQGVFEGAPRINAPYVTGNRPNTEFVFAVPTSGERPVNWSAEGLPEGLALNEATGIIRGVVKKSGDYPVKITARNAKGSKTSVLTIRIGDELALTPVMGWNSWNTFGPELTEALVLETADAMVENGMRDMGYQYINMDDFWQLTDRGEDGHIQVNKEKFPRGIKYVADYLHERGFRLGIYSDASRYTCGGVCGSYGYEEIDARDFAAWGVDLLKYDYCGAPDVRDTAIVRYRKMGEALKRTDRSIVYNVCIWGHQQPWEWTTEVGGHYWRTTGDIRDKWSTDNPDFLGIINIVDRNKVLADYAGPGAWNDPDMLTVGMFGKSFSINDGRSDFGCTLAEYRSHMSLWCMMASPLLSGNDVRVMSDSVKSILLNEEVIAVNQDVLGKQGRPVRTEGNCEIWMKELSDGYAVAVLNRADMAETIELDFKAIGISEKFKIRDLWNHKNLKGQQKLSLNVAPHATEVFKLTK